MSTAKETINKKRKNISDKVKTKRKKHLVNMENPDTERLEKLVIGDPSYMLRNMGFGDPDSGVEDDGGIHDSDGAFSDTLASPPRVPAWVDEDDITSIGAYTSGQYEKTLRKKYQCTHGEPSWAKLDKEPDPNLDDEDCDLLRSCGNMLNKSRNLTKSMLYAKRLPPLNGETRNEGPLIKAVQFHPTSSVALVAGVSGTASILKVDGETNPKLASVQFHKYPIKCARFSSDGNEFIVGSNISNHFYVYDMLQGSTIPVYIHSSIGQTHMKKFEVSPDGKLIAVSGRFGQIHLLTAKSKEWIGNLSMNGNVEAVTFDADGSHLYSHGELGEIYIWDINRRCLIGRFYDDGCLNGTNLSISPCGTYLAVGSSSGVVNLYDNKLLLNKIKSTPKPLKSIMNLTTPLSDVTFNHSSQLLAICSHEKENAIKMVHLPSMTVYKNFPNTSTQFSRIQTVAFSPLSGYFSFSNNKNTAFLFRLKHFSSY